MKNILNRKQAGEIRSLYRENCHCCGGKKFTMAALAQKFGVTAPAIHKIITNKTYKEI